MASVFEMHPGNFTVKLFVTTDFLFWYLLLLLKVAYFLKFSIASSICEKTLQSNN